MVDVSQRLWILEVIVDELLDLRNKQIYESNIQFEGRDNIAHFGLWTIYTDWKGF